MAEPEVKLCLAKTRKGTPCQKKVMPGRNRCRYHGGKTPRGQASPHFQHGFFSRYWKDEAKEIYDKLAKGEITGLEAAHQAHALATARMYDVLAYVEQKPELKLDKILSQVQTEYRLAARQIAEAETAQRIEDVEPKTRPVFCTFELAEKPNSKK